MAGTPKRRMTSSRKRRRNSQPIYQAELPQLTKLPSGKLVPTHMVTPENPVYKGVKFLKVKRKSTK